MTSDLYIYVIMVHLDTVTSSSKAMVIVYGHRRKISTKVVGSTSSDGVQISKGVSCFAVHSSFVFGMCEFHISPRDAQKSRKKHPHFTRGLRKSGKHQISGDWKENLADILRGVDAEAK